MTLLLSSYKHINTTVTWNLCHQSWLRHKNVSLSASWSASFIKSIMNCRSYSSLMYSALRFLFWISQQSLRIYHFQEKRAVISGFFFFIHIINTLQILLHLLVQMNLSLSLKNLQSTCCRNWLWHKNKHIDIKTLMS